MKKITLYFILFYNILTYATPIGNSNQYFCTTSNPTIANIVVTGNPIYWFTTNDNSGTPLLETDILSDNTIYYAFDSTDSNADSLSVMVHLIDPIPAPNYDNFMPITIACESANITLLQLPITNTDGYEEFFWFSTDNQMDGTQLTPDTIVNSNLTYYAFQGLGECAQSLTVTVSNQDPIPAPFMDSDNPITICENNNLTLGDLPVFNTSGYDGIYWYSTETQESGTELPLTTLLEEGTTYYAFQSICFCNGCTGILSVTVELIENIPVPTGEEIQGFCMDSTPTLNDLIVENTAGYDTIYWFASSCQESEPVDSTTPLYDGDVYYAFQAMNNCCPPSLEVTVDFMTCLGVDDNQIANFDLKPNPIKNILSLDFVVANNKTTVIIYNIFGSLVYKNNFHQKNDININVSNLNAGVYFINTKVDNKISTKKFIKL